MGAGSAAWPPPFLLLESASGLSLASFLYLDSGSAKCPLCSVCALPVSEVLFLFSVLLGFEPGAQTSILSPGATSLALPAVSLSGWETLFRFPLSL